MTSYGPIEPIIFVLYLMAFFAVASVIDLRNSAANEKRRSSARWWHGFILALISIALLYPMDSITYTGGTIDYIWSKEIFNALLLFVLTAATWLQTTSTPPSRFILPLAVIAVTPVIILFATYAFQGNASYPGFPTPRDLIAFETYIEIALATGVLGVLLGLRGRLQGIQPSKQPGS